MLTSAGPYWTYRRLIWAGAWADVRHRYAGSALGGFWNIVTPLTLLVLYTLIFSGLKPVQGESVAGVPFALYLSAGFLPWIAFAEALQRGTMSIVGNAAFLKKLPIPEQVFVAQAAVSGWLSALLMVALLVMAAVLLGQPAAWSWLLLPILALGWHAFGFGLSLLLGALNAFFRDVGPIVGVVLQVWMWSIPVVYAEELLPEPYRGILPFNPVYPFLRAGRDLLLRGSLPDGLTAGMAVVWILLSVAAGTWVLQSLRSEIRDVL